MNEQNMHYITVQDLCVMSPGKVSASQTIALLSEQSSQLTLPLPLARMSSGRILIAASTPSAQPDHDSGPNPPPIP